MAGSHTIFLFWHNSSVAETYKKIFCVLTSLFCLTGTHKNHYPMLTSLLWMAGELILHSLCGRRTHKNHYPMLKSLVCLAGELILYSLCGRKTHKTIILFCPLYGRNRNSCKNISCSDITPLSQKLRKYFMFWNHSSVWQELIKTFLTSLLCMAGTHKNISCSDITLLSGRNSSKLLSYSVITRLYGRNSYKNIFLFWQNSSMAETYKKYFVFWHHSSVWQELIKTIILCWHHSSEWQELKKVLFRCQSYV